MIGFDYVRVYPVYPTGFDVTWELIGAGALGKYTFSIQKSANGDDWEDIAQVTDSNNYIDTSTPASIRHTQVYYRVHVLSPLGEEATSEAVITYNNPEKKTFLLAKEIVRRANLLYREMNGVELAVLKRKMWGEKCVCRHSITGGTIDSQCVSCYGLEYKGGYHTPVYIYGHIEPVPVTERQSTEVGNTDVSNTTGIISNYPLLRKGDIIVELHNNNRWYIKDVQLTEAKRFPVSQRFQISLIERTDVIYKYELRKPIKNL